MRGVHRRIVCSGYRSLAESLHPYPPPPCRTEMNAWPEDLPRGSTILLSGKVSRWLGC